MKFSVGDRVRISQNAAGEYIHTIPGTEGIIEYYWEDYDEVSFKITRHSKDNSVVGNVYDVSIFHIERIKPDFRTIKHLIEK